MRARRQMKMPETKRLSEQEKVRKVYEIAGDRGLYVNTNFDVFSDAPEWVSLAMGAGYKVPLIKPGTNAYASPLLFVTLTSLLNHGTMLLTGGPGIGKTTSSELAGPLFIGTSLEEILASEIQGHPQLTEEKMVASYDLGKLVHTGERVVIPNKFLESAVRIIDEGNRIPPDTLSILMKLVDTGKAVYGGNLLTARPGPLFVTANYADEGTFQFTPPFLDRFDAAVMVTSPAPWDLRKIRNRGDEKLNGSNLEGLTHVNDGLKLDIPAIRKEINEMPEAVEYNASKVENFSDFVYSTLRFSEAASQNIERATKGNAWKINQDNASAGHFINAPHTKTLNELTIRTMRAMPRYAKAFAWFNGDKEVDVSHLKTVMPYLLWHKVQPSQAALTDNPHYHNDRIAFIEDLIKDIETQYDDFRGSPIHKEVYIPALMAIKSGEYKEKTINEKGEEGEEKLKKIVRNAITQLGNIDKPWAVTLANHLASEYNHRNNGDNR